MLRARPLLFLPVLALVLGLVAVAHPADAAARRPSVSVKATSSTVALQGTTTVTGRVSGRSPGAKVKLQRRTGGAWTTITRTKVRKNKTYRFTVTIRDAKNTFRVQVVKNRSLRSATSKTITIAGTIAGTSADDATRNLILQKTNEFRALNGRSPLQLMPELNAIAQEWSAYMAATSDFRHRPSFAAAYPAGWTNAGENIAAGQSPETVVDAWIESPGHRANLLGDFNYIGIGYATGGTYGRYFTQNFAKYPGR